MLKYKKNLFLFLITFSVAIFFTNFTIAASLEDAGDNLKVFGRPAGYAVTGTGSNIDVLIGEVIKTILSFLGVVFLVLLVYAGVLWMQARGDSDYVQKAKDTMINATIGLIIVLGAYAATYFITTYLTYSTLQ